MSAEQPPALRSDVIADMVQEIVTGLGEGGLTPPEALTVAEVTLWHFFDKTIEGATANGEEMQRQAKLLCARVLNRLAARVDAWPAKTHERQ